MVPGARVIARPGRRIALASGIGGARKHERAHVALQLAQPFVGRPRIFHAEDVVEGALGFRPAAVHAIRNLEGSRLVRAHKDRRLVHVVPEPAHAHGHKILVERAPPSARRCPGEIGKDARSGPDDAGIYGAVGIVREIVSCQSLVVRLVARELRDVQVGNRHEFESQRVEAADHAWEIGEALRVNRKGPVFFLIINVEIQNVRRDLLLAKRARDLLNARLRSVAVTRLLEPERPEGRKRRASREVRIALDHLLGVESVNEVIVEVPALRAEGIGVRVGMAKVELRAPSVVEKNSVGAPLPQRQKERNVLVERVGALLPAIRVGVPHGV